MVRERVEMVMTLLLEETLANFVNGLQGKNKSYKSVEFVTFLKV